MRHAATMGMTVVLASACSGAAGAGFTLYNTDFEGWQAATGAYETIDFTGFQFGTIITDQYVDQGVNFVDGNDYVIGSEGSVVFPIDGWGLTVGDSATLQFASPQYSFGLHHPGGLRIDLFWQGELVYHSPPLPGGGPGWFVGVVSTTPFDKALIYDVDGGLAVDNIYFGIPAPAAGLLLFGLPLAAGRHRRGRFGD